MLATTRYDNDVWKVLVNLEGLDIRWQPHLLAFEEILLWSVVSNIDSVGIIL
jgi:hypothetical protein